MKKAYITPSVEMVRNIQTLMQTTSIAVESGNTEGEGGWGTAQSLDLDDEEEE